MKVSVQTLWRPRRWRRSCVPPTSAAAEVPHTVQAGETLWSIAAANNFTTRALAAANGLPEDAQVVAREHDPDPVRGGGRAALGDDRAAPAAHRLRRASSTACWAPTRSSPATRCPRIAAASGVSVGQVAWMNGLDPEQPLPAGAALKLPASAAPAEAVPAGQSPPAVVVDAAPNPTPETVTASQIGEVASSHGVSPSLAAAVAWQESGFQNGVVSSANARGVMQILPGHLDLGRAAARGPIA